jgi:hypothetical protein
MDNHQILMQLEQHRDALFLQLNTTSISKLYKEQYAEIKSGRLYVFNNEERQLLSDLEKLSKDTSYDVAYQSQLAAYLNLNNEELITYFQNELVNVLGEIRDSGKQDQIQAFFIEYDYYYHFTSCIICYGLQAYPLVSKPRYLFNEFDYDKQVLLVSKGINFKPAWLDCSEFDTLDYLDVNNDMEQLFKLHSRTLLHRALDRLNSNGQLAFLKARPFTIYINEHDSEVMTLYRLNEASQQ